MKNLLSFIIENILGPIEFDIHEGESEGKTILTVTTPADSVGLLIGKEGKTIKNIRRILSILATKEDKMVMVDVEPKV